jgi:hypothetical protein
MTMVPPICVLCGRDSPHFDKPKGANQWLKSLQPNELPLVLRARPAAAGAARHSRAAKSNRSPRRTEAKKIWKWRRNSCLGPELALQAAARAITSAKRLPTGCLFAANKVELSPPSKCGNSLRYSAHQPSSVHPVPRMLACCTCRVPHPSVSRVRIFSRFSLPPCIARL